MVKAENIYWNTMEMHKMMETKLSIKQLLETLFLTIKMCIGFTIDGICMNTMCAVSLTSHLRAVADVFRPLRTH